MFVVLSKYKKGLENFQKSFKPLAVSWVCVGHFHTTRWTNRLDGQIVSDKQIFWCENRTNKFLDEQIIWYLSIWIDDFSKRICPSRQTSQQQYDIKSHQMVKWLSFPLQGNATSNRTAKTMQNVWKSTKHGQKKNSQHLHMYLCQMKSEIKHKLVLLSFPIQEVCTWVPLTHYTRNFRPTDVFLGRKICYTVHVQHGGCFAFSSQLEPIDSALYTRMY